MQAIVMIPALVALIAASGDPRQPLAAGLRNVIERFNATTQILLPLASRGGSVRTRAQEIWTRAEGLLREIMRVTTLITSPGASSPMAVTNAQRVIGTLNDAVSRYREQVLALKRSAAGAAPRPAPAPGPAPAPAPDAPPPADEEGGFLSRIPWWGWALGVAAVGAGAYMIATSGEESESQAA